MPITVRFKMQEGAEDLAPKKAHEDDAAWDLKSRVDVDAAPGKVTLIPTGLFLELPAGYEAQIRPRSGLALKNAVTLLNTPGTIDAGYRGEVCGTIDAGYRGEVCVILFNAGENVFSVHRGDRIAQMVIAALPDVVLSPAVELNETDRNAGGFGSTGVH